MKLKLTLCLIICVSFLNVCQTADRYLYNLGNDIVNNGNEIRLSDHVKFDRSYLNRIRAPYLTSGISAQDVNIELKLAQGNYKIIAYLEAGYTDSVYLTSSINGKTIKNNWQIFSPQAEGRNKPQKMYRILNCDLTQDKDLVELDYHGISDSVRLLAFYIFPIDEGFSNIDLNLEESLNLIGNINSDVSSEEIRSLKSQNSLSVSNSFNSYLKLKLEEFALALDLFNMMGWEKGNVIYGMGIFDRLNQAVMLLDGIIGDPWIDNYFGERARLIRGKILWWLNRERGGKEELAAALTDLQYLNNLYPENELIRMYLGEKIDTPDRNDSLQFHHNAPEWSKLQYEVLSRLKDEVKWWVNVRQADNGELGGKIGDDVEILRWWSVLAAYGDTNTIKGWKKLGNAVWNDPKVYKGYSQKPIDVEHSSEFISDTFPEMIYFDNENAGKYLKPSANYFKDLWTFKNNFGRRFFKSSWFSSTEVKTDQPRNRDLSLNSRAVKAVRFLAWNNNDADLINALYEWSKAWRDLALREDKGKPIGLFPASVRGIDEQFNGDGPNWYNADMYWDYFDWEHGASLRFYDQLLFSSILNKDSLLLEPLKLTLDLIKQHGHQKGFVKIGSREWASNIIIENQRFWNIVLQYRVLTGDKSYDDLIVKHGNDYSKYLITKNNKYIVEGLDKLLNDIRFNTPLRTTEVIHTDRVRTSDIITLKGMITGNDSYETDSPFLAATYSNTGDGLTMLVMENSSQELKIKFYSHSKKTINPNVKVWLLEYGDYLHKVVDELENVLTESILNINERGQEIEIMIPPNEEITLLLNKLK